MKQIKEKKFLLSNAGQNDNEIPIKPIAVLLSINEYVDLSLLIKAVESDNYPDLLHYIERRRRNGYLSSLKESLTENHYYTHGTKYLESETA